MVASSENSMTSIPLKRLAKLRIKSRGEPEFDNFDEYMNVRTSCWILVFSGYEGQALQAHGWHVLHGRYHGGYLTRESSSSWSEAQERKTKKSWKLLDEIST